MHVCIYMCMCVCVCVQLLFLSSYCEDVVVPVGGNEDGGSDDDDWAMAVAAA